MYRVKTSAIVVLMAVMQLVFIVCALALGFVLGVPGQLAAGMVLPLILAVVPGIAVVAWQSLLSILIRSFTAPIGIALVASVLSIGVLVGGATAATYGLTPATLTSVMWMGNTASANAQNLTGAFIPYAVAALFSTVLAFVVGAVFLNRTDVRT